MSPLAPNLADALSTQQVGNSPPRNDTRYGHRTAAGHPLQTVRVTGAHPAVTDDGPAASSAPSARPNLQRLDRDARRERWLDEIEEAS